MTDTRDQLKGKTLPVLDDGFVKLIDYMGDDFFPVRTARLSCDNRPGTDDLTLLRMLLRHWHSEPFEFNEIVFHVRAPMDVWRQWLRHRTGRYGSVNEYSTRYSPAIDSAQSANSEWRAQSKNNKQGSAGLILVWPNNVTVSHDHAALTTTVCIKQEDGSEYCQRFDGVFYTPADLLDAEEERLHEETRSDYETRLALGVAKEQARKDLPLSTYTECYVKCDLWNLMHFLRLRKDAHAQQEIRAYANVVGEFVEALFPKTYDAFEDYILNAINFTQTEIAALCKLLVFSDRLIEEGAGLIVNKRERAEFLAKIERLRECNQRLA